MAMPKLPSSGVALREPRPGDMGWVVQRHGALYAREYGWDWRFEGLVAEIVAGFVARFDPERERCWIAEREGMPVGSVLVARVDERTAQLRLLLVEPQARSEGVGRRLVQACIAFARERGYRRLMLWTQSDLLAARALYRSCGFVLTETAPHAKFGVPVTGETWELQL